MTIGSRLDELIGEAKKQKEVSEQLLHGNEVLRWTWRIDAYQFVKERCGELPLPNGSWNAYAARLLDVTFPNPGIRAREAQEIADELLKLCAPLLKTQPGDSE
ncbi:hypothetical protein K8R03_00155 [Candidatus Kaiserbacteria bacterium]|nr:hypothetical protein [Candidatus Kaiserbacteria bacterium]